MTERRRSKPFMTKGAERVLRLAFLLPGLLFLVALVFVLIRDAL